MVADEIVLITKAGHRKKYIPELVEFDRLNVINENSSLKKHQKRLKRLELLKDFYKLRKKNKHLLQPNIYKDVMNLK